MPDGALGLEQWFKNQHQWWQDAARRLIEKRELSSTDLNELTLLCKSEAGIPQPEGSRLQARGIPMGALTAADPSRKFSLLCISNVRGVNALRPRTALEFAPNGLTVVYGSNASGKSGYVRLLKHASGASGAGLLHGDVFKAEDEPKTAEVVVTENSGEHRSHWNQETGAISTLKGIDIYDMDAGRVYINEKHEVTYEPFPLKLLAQLADDVCGEVKRRIDAEIAARPMALPALPPEFGATDSSAWYALLNKGISEKDISNRCAWNDQDAAGLSALEQQLSAKKPKEQATALRTQRANIEILRNTIQALFDSLSDGKATAFRAAKAAAAQKRKAAQDDADRIFRGMLEGVGTDTWRSMWEAARKYSEELAYPGRPYPVVDPDAVCVLCQQPLSDPAVRDRLSDFERFVRGELQREAEKAQSEFQTLENALGVPPGAEILKVSLEAAGLIEGRLVEAIRGAMQRFAQRRAAIVGEDPIDEFPAIPERSILRILQDCASQLDNEAKSFDDLEPKRAEIENKARELRTRKWLSENINSVRAEVARQKALDLLDAAKKLTNPRGLTEKKASLFEQLITTEFVRSFKRELERLQASGVSVELRSLPPDHGHIFHELILREAKKDAPLAEVLSEGESRIVSLAAFLADANGRGSKTPVIFDDPVASMDNEYEGATARRLVSVARERQVVVFTHRVSFVVGLQSEAESCNVPCHTVCVRSDAFGTGEPGGMPPNVQALQQELDELLSRRIKEAKDLYDAGNIEASRCPNHS